MIILPETTPKQFQRNNDESNQFPCFTQLSEFHSGNHSPEIGNLIGYDEQASRSISFTFDQSLLSLNVSMLSNLDHIGQEELNYQQIEQQSQGTQQKKEQHQVSFLIEPLPENVNNVNLKVYLL